MLSVMNTRPPRALKGPTLPYAALQSDCDWKVRRRPVESTRNTYDSQVCEMSALVASSVFCFVVVAASTHVA